MFGTWVRRITGLVSVVKSVLENLYVKKDGEYVSILDSLLGKDDCDKCRSLESDTDTDTETEDDRYPEWPKY